MSYLKTVFITAIVLFMALAVNAQKKVKIKGSVSNYDATEIFLYDISGENQLAVSALNSEMKFTMEIDIKEPNFYRLQLDDYSVIFLILEAGDNIEIAINGEDIRNPKISGSKQSELAYTSLEKVAEYDKRITEMTEKIQAEKLEFIRKFIRENKSSLSTLFFIEELNTENEEDIKLYTETIENLHKTFPNNELVNELFGKINKVEIGEGSIAPEITLPNEAGEMVSLSSLKGKVVLIDFWASWCAPCRAEMPNLTTAYQSYKSKGFEIYSISLDRTREPWIEAKNADKMTWICVHDINGSYGGVYGVEAIPYTVLIDKDGKIIATNLRGTELEEKLAELFK